MGWGGNIHRRRARPALRLTTGSVCRRGARIFPPSNRFSVEAPGVFTISLSARVPQDKLYGLLRREIQDFGLFRSNQQIDHLHQNRFAFSVLLIILAGGKHLNVLQQGARNGADILLRAPGGEPATSTSTRIPATAKPATPTTSFTCTAKARMPGRNR